MLSLYTFGFFLTYFLIKNVFLSDQTTKYLILRANNILLTIYYAAASSNAPSNCFKNLAGLVGNNYNN